MGDVHYVKHTTDVLVIYGTRPEAIKLSPLIVRLRQALGARLSVAASGQHTALVDGIPELWRLTPNIVLQKVRDVPPTHLLPTLLQDIGELIEHLNPKLIVVQGDTSTALAATLSAFSRAIPVAHVEAGLRSFDNLNPWPEEGYRRSIDGMSSMLFAPTLRAESNLRSEQLPGNIYLTGNTVVDALISIRELIRFDNSVIPELPTYLQAGDAQFVLFTQHRRESFGDRIEHVLAAVRQIAENGIPVVFPVHPNPEVVKRANNMLGTSRNVTLLPPLNYLHFLRLLSMCRFVISDSGGLQEEVPSFGKRILVTRTATERPEILESGHGILCGYDTDRIVREAAHLMSALPLTDSANPFGDGHASERITSEICNFLGQIA